MYIITAPNTIQVVRPVNAQGASPGGIQNLKIVQGQGGQIQVHGLMPGTWNILF